MSRILVDDLHKGWLKDLNMAHVRALEEEFSLVGALDRSAHSRRTDPGAGSATDEDYSGRHCTAGERWLQTIDSHA